MPAALTATALALFCAVPAHAIDMKIVTVSSTGEVMQGVIHARMNMTSTFDLASSDGKTTCTGDTNGKGQGTLKCSDGRSYPLAIKGYGRFQGAYVAQYGKESVAIGWGKKAKKDSLAKMLP